jgi:biotin carboxylase/acetyl-CoA carboxylase carboxyltransferase component/biotin carboxyl carrier protein
MVDEIERHINELGGHSAIRKIFLANNGMAALKFVLSLEEYSFRIFGRQVFQFYGMATPADKESGAEYIAKLDRYVDVPDGHSAETFGNVPLVVGCAKSLGADCVWPGWGHASENSDLPRALEQAGIRFLGPTERAMAALGDKVSSNRLCEECGVKSIPWKEVQDVRDCETFRREHGLPLMLKASRGGGGKGIREIHREERMAVLLEEVHREVPGEVFITKLVRRARHLELQVVADLLGGVEILGGRDCTLQRRNQKLVEEAPITVASPEVVEKMKADAKKLVAASGYTGVATVEFLYDMDSKEVNSRLQVEHPVTDLLFGTNLCAAQVLLASGVSVQAALQSSLCMSPGKGPWGTNPEDRHVLGARIVAENAEDGFQPSSGSVRVLFQGHRNAFGVFSIVDGKILACSDSQFGHVFHVGRGRKEAIDGLRAALSNVRVSGVKTPIRHIQRLLGSDEFKENEHTTKFAESLFPQRRIEELAVLAFCAVASDKAENSLEFVYRGERFKTETSRVSEREVAVEMNGSVAVVKYERLGEHWIIIRERNARVAVIQSGSSYDLVLFGETHTFELDTGDDKFYSPTHGKIIRFLRQSAEEGEEYVQIEVMKMIVTLKAPRSGKIVPLKGPGCEIVRGEALAQVAGGRDRKNGRTFEGKLTQTGEPVDYTPGIFRGFPVPRSLWIYSNSPERMEEAYVLYKGMLRGKTERRTADEYMTEYSKQIVQMDVNKESAYRMHKILEEVLFYVGTKEQNRKLFAPFHKLASHLFRSMSPEHMGELGSPSLVGANEVHLSLDRRMSISADSTRRLFVTYTIAVDTPASLEIVLKRVIVAVLNASFSSPKEFLNNQVTLHIGLETGRDFSDCARKLYEKYREEIIRAGIYDLHIVMGEGKAHHRFLYEKGYLEYSRDVCGKRSTMVEGHEVPATGKRATDGWRIQRNKAIVAGTTYIRDFVELVLLLLEEKSPSCKEIFLVSGPEGKETEESGGVHYSVCGESEECSACEEIGMKAWEIETEGNPFILLGHDITHKSGAFSVLEDIFFALVSRRARRNGVPLVYVSANSGAKIDMLEDLKREVKIHVTKKGELVFYLEKRVCEQMKGKVVASTMDLEGREVCRVESVVGYRGMGVENLSYSALIAREMAESYEKIFTLTYVTGRGVGIGAYLARLGHRVIQKENSPLILTGYQALNRLLGHKKYASNIDLGGPGVLGRNGVVHQVVQNEVDGALEILRWLDFYFTSSQKRSFVWSEGEAIPESANEQEIVDHLFDKGTFNEYQRGWAPNVVVGRAKICGVSCGAIFPAVGTGREGRSWTENVITTEGAEKISQAIEDFGREGLDVFVLVHWKGFAAGDQDMLDGVLKTGSNIVRSIGNSRTKIFVYLGPNAELRGGAWVVFDKMIGKQVTFMSHPTGRGGVMQPDGTMEIKFKEEERRKMIERSGYIAEDSLLVEAGRALCDMHDSSTRMKMMGAIHEVISLDVLRKAVVKCFTREADHTGLT